MSNSTDGMHVQQHHVIASTEKQELARDMAKNGPAIEGSSTNWGSGRASDTGEVTGECREMLTPKGGMCHRLWDPHPHHH